MDECKPLADGTVELEAWEGHSELPRLNHANEGVRAHLIDAGRFWLSTTRDGAPGVDGSGLHSSTFRLNVSAMYGIGGARRGCVARVKGVFGGVEGL